MRIFTMILGLLAALCLIGLSFPPMVYSVGYRYDRIDITLWYPTLSHDAHHRLQFSRTLHLTDESEGESTYIEPLRGRKLLCGFRYCNDFSNPVRKEWLQNQRETRAAQAMRADIQAELDTSAVKRRQLVASYQNGHCDALQAGPSEPDFSCTTEEFWRPLGACVGQHVGVFLCKKGMGGLIGHLLPSMARDLASSQTCKATMAKLMGEEYNIEQELIAEGQYRALLFTAKVAATALLGKIGDTAVDIGATALDIATCVPKMSNRCERNYSNWGAAKERHFSMYEGEIQTCRTTKSEIAALERQIAELNQRAVGVDRQLVGLALAQADLERQATVVQV